MFTILLRYKKTRREVIISAESVEFIPNDGKKGTGIDNPGLLINHGVEAKSGYHLAMTPEGDEDWRDVFVMNNHGQTVARYTL